MYDADTVHDDSAISSADYIAIGSTPLRWPPPGLEGLQGTAWRTVAMLAAGTAIMTAPLLLSIVTARSFWSIGIFAGSWWLPIAAALAGLLILLAGFERLTRLLFDGAKAVQRGHDWATVAFVVSDARHDAGFLLQGARQYSTLEERDRRMLLAARVVAVCGYAAALLWMPIAFTIGVLFAGRGVIASGGALLTLVLFPGGLLLIAALLAHVFEARTTRDMVRAWRRESANEARLLDEVTDWRADRATRLIHITPASRRTVGARVVAVLLIVIAVLLPLPVATLALASAMGPAFVQLATPRLESAAARVAKAETLAVYAVPPDASITPQDAGETLHALAFTGAQARLHAVERAPVRRYDAWPRESKPVTLPNIEAFGTQLIPRARSLTAEEVAYLERVVAYPAMAELSRVARARAADLAGARWHTDRLAAAAIGELPVPRFAGLRDATQFHTARAVLELARGDTAAAEITLREIISVGLLVTREGPTFIDVLVGTSIATNGAAALQTLYQTAGRTVDADALRRPQQGIDRMEALSRAVRTRGDGDGLRQSMAVAANEQLPRGMRWEGLAAIQSGGACLNPHTVVFGHGREYDEWLESARSSLVRYPSEQALFDLTLRRPALPVELQRRAGILQRIFALTLGRAEAAGTCAALLTGLSAD